MYPIDGFFSPSHGKRSWIDGGRCRERRGVGDRRNMCAKSRQTLTQPGIILLERHDVAPWVTPSSFLRRLRMPARGKRRISRDITIRRYVRDNNFSRVRVFHKGSHPVFDIVDSYARAIQRQRKDWDSISLIALHVLQAYIYWRRRRWSLQVIMVTRSLTARLRVRHTHHSFALSVIYLRNVT